MKSRRVLTHAQLISEVIDQAKSRFSPDIQMIDNFGPTIRQAVHWKK